MVGDLTVCFNVFFFPMFESVVQNSADEVLHDRSGGSSYLNSKHHGKHYNTKYRQHDHISEMGLLNGGQVSAHNAKAGATATC